MVISHYIDRAEECLTSAAASAEAAVAEAERVADLDEGGTPESIMMSTMTEEGERQRNERKLLVPWLIFLWETYRSVLDILRSNSKLELVYHKTAERAFTFCQQYKRKVEFRRLCEMLRTHLTNLQKANVPFGTAPVNDKRLRGWDGWREESIEMHLNTRFKQLEVTTQLELWTEGFRTVEDIFTIMHIQKKPPKSKVMATYYEKLIKIFWVSENYLFHAYAWFKYYTLCESFNKNLTDAEKCEMASSVVLAALAIPSLGDDADNAADMAEKAIDESTASAALLKNQHMAGLLGFNTNPSRSGLMNDLNARRLLELTTVRCRMGRVGGVLLDEES